MYPESIDFTPESYINSKYTLSQEVKTWDNMQQWPTRG